MFLSAFLAGGWPARRLPPVSDYSVPALFGLAWFAVSRRGTLYFVRPVLRGKVLLKALGNGSSEMVTYLSEAVVTFLFNMTMLRYLGADGVAAITIVLYTDALLVGMYLGYGIGVAPVLSYNYGQRDPGTARAAF